MLIVDDADAAFGRLLDHPLILDDPPGGEPLDWRQPVAEKAQIPPVCQFVQGLVLAESIECEVGIPGCAQFGLDDGGRVADDQHDPASLPANEPIQHQVCAYALNQRMLAPGRDKELRQVAKELSPASDRSSGVVPR